MKTDKTQENRETEINVNGEILEWVAKHVYLGSAISGDGDGSREIKRRLALATNKLSKSKLLWHGQDPQTKLRILRTWVLRIDTNGCETSGAPNDGFLLNSFSNTF